MHDVASLGAEYLSEYFYNYFKMLDTCDFFINIFFFILLKLVFDPDLQ